MQCSAYLYGFHIDFDLLMSHYPVSSFKAFRKIYVFILNLAPLVIFSERVSSNNLSQHIFRHKTSSLIFHLSFPPHLILLSPSFPEKSLFFVSCFHINTLDQLYQWINSGPRHKTCKKSLLPEVLSSVL